MHRLYSGQYNQGYTALYCTVRNPCLVRVTSSIVLPPDECARLIRGGVGGCYGMQVCDRTSQLGLLLQSTAPLWYLTHALHAAAERRCNI
jgi:hypothetical protein